MAEDPRDDSFWPQIAGDWSQLGSKIRRRWDKLSDEDLEYMGGDRERTLSRLRERYAESSWNENDVERELASMRNL